ncbi:MAG: hypothetical protein ACYC4S_09625 [Rhodoferax sp.]
MDQDNSIDATEFLYIPLPCLEEIIFKLDASAPGTDFVLTFIRWLAVLLICGEAVPDYTSAQAAVHRGVEMLGILRAYAQHHPI